MVGVVCRLTTFPKGRRYAGNYLNSEDACKATLLPHANARARPNIQDELFPWRHRPPIDGLRD
jgi:hypothetical protein